MLWKDKKSSLRLDFAVSEWPCTRTNEVLCALKMILRIRIRISVHIINMYGNKCNTTKRYKKRKSRNII